MSKTKEDYQRFNSKLQEEIENLRKKCDEGTIGDSVADTLEELTYSGEHEEKIRTLKVARATMLMASLERALDSFYKGGDE